MIGSYIKHLTEKFELKNTYSEGNKFWYSDTLIKASEGLPVKTMPINIKLLYTKIYWT